jgi:imidazolonepropionase-like amidohydrolase
VSGVPAGITAFIDVAVVPMDTERVLANQTVLVKGGRITALGPASQVKVPAGAVRIEGRGQYLIPGLADMHVHLSTNAKDGENAQMSPDNLAERRLFLWLADGVTTVRNMDYMAKGAFKLDGPSLLRLRARAAAGELWSPRIYTAGQWAPRQYTNAYWPGDEGVTMSRQPPPGEPTPKLDSVAAYVAAYKAAGYDFIKVHEEKSEIFEALLAAARLAGIPVMGHVPDGVRVEQAWAGSMRSIEHLKGYDWFRERPTSDIVAIAEATQRAGVWNCPTIQGIVLLPAVRALVKALQDAEAGLLLGSDRPDDSEAIHGELEALVQAGLTPYQALATGTRNVAAFFKTPDETGTVAVGKRADLVLLRGNPLTDIRNTRQPAGVMIGGRWLARAEIDRRVAAMRGE